MDNKITKKRLEEMFKQVHQETGSNLQADIEKVIESDKEVSIHEFVNETLPSLIGAVFTNATAHTEYLIEDVLKELDLLKDDD